MSEDIIRTIIDRVYGAAITGGFSDRNQIMPTLEKIEEDARQHWGGDRVFISKKRTQDRNKKILEEINNGATIADVSIKYNVSVRHIRRILTKNKKM